MAGQIGAKAPRVTPGHYIASPLMGEAGWG